MQEIKEEVEEVGSAVHPEFKITPMVMLQNFFLTSMNIIL
jgi:hypothetical protein